MKVLYALALSAFVAAPAQSEVDLGTMIAELGLEGTLNALQDTPFPAPHQDFALAATHFLRGIERNLQTRFANNLTGGDLAIPGLSLGLPGNPAPEPFDPAVIARLFEDIQTDMALARDVLPIGEDAVVTIGVNQVWFDINRNGRQDPGESFAATALAAVMGERASRSFIEELEKGDENLPPIRFDSADTYWLLAYTHLMSGTAELVLSFDPTPAIDRVLGADQRLFGDREQLFMGLIDDRTINLIAVVLEILDTQPDAARTQAAQDHFLAMMDANIAFWQALDLETDDATEWIPNARQTGVLPLALPQDIGTGWQAVLAETRAILTGEVLIPHPRGTRDATGTPVQGINIGAWLQNPAPVDIIRYAHGFGLEAYFETGAVADFSAMQEFQTLTGGNFLVFALLLN